MERKYFLEDLTSIERIKLKRKAMQLKKAEEKNLEKKKKEGAIKAYQKALQENKKNRVDCLKEYRKRKIQQKIYGEKMKEYERIGYILELQIALEEKELIKSTYFVKRVNYFILFLGFLNGIEKMSIIDTNETKRLLSVQDIYLLFLDFLLEEEKANLEVEQKIRKLFMLINSMKDYPLEETHSFYLNDEEKIQMYAKILEQQEKITNIEKQEKNKNDVSLLIVDDFFNSNTNEVYERIFLKRDIKQNR